MNIWKVPNSCCLMEENCQQEDNAIFKVNQKISCLQKCWFRIIITVINLWKINLKWWVTTDDTFFVSLSRLWQREPSHFPFFMWVPSNNQTILLFRISIPRGRSMCTVVWRCLEGALEETSSLCFSPTSAVLSFSRSSRFSHLSSPGGLLWWAQWSFLRSCCSTLCFGLVATISVEFLFPAPMQLQSRERTSVPRVELANTLQSSPHFCSRLSQVRLFEHCVSLVWPISFLFQDSTSLTLWTVGQEAGPTVFAASTHHWGSSRLKITITISTHQ